MSRREARNAVIDMPMGRSNQIPTVAHVITGLKIGGAEMMLYKLLANVALNGNMRHVVVSLRKMDVIGERIESLGVPVYPLNGTPTDPSWTTRLVTTLRSIQPDVIQGWMYHANLASTLAAPFLRKSKSRNVPVVWGIRALPSSVYSRPTRGIIWMGARLSNRPGSIVYNSNASAVAHSNIGYKSDRSVIVHNGFDTELFKPSDSARAALRNELRIPENAPVIGLLARFSPAKDFDNFFAAFAKVQSVIPSVHAVLAGTNVLRDNPEIQALLEKYSIVDNIHLLGERHDTNDIWAACDVGCSSSITESFSNSIGEAMSCGVPCVVTDVGDSATIIADSGVVVPPGNPGILAKALMLLLQLDDREFVLKRISARARIENVFGMNAAGQAFEDVYRAVISA